MIVRGIDSNTGPTDCVLHSKAKGYTCFQELNDATQSGNYVCASVMSM